MLFRQLTRIPFKPGDNPPDDPAIQVRACILQCRYGNSMVVLPCGNMAAHHRFNELFQRLLILTHERCCAAKCCDNAGIILFAQQRQKLVADFISQILLLAGRHIGNKRNTALAQPGFNLAPLNFAQGAYDIPVAAGRNAGKASQRCAPHKAHENGFGLVICMMGKGELM